jgi:hypothetical protein
MKKTIIFILSVLVILFVLSSCKKDFVCECSYTDVIGDTGTFSWEIEDRTKKDAGQACEEFDFAGWTDIMCELK